MICLDPNIQSNIQEEIFHFFKNRNFEKSRRFTSEYSAQPLRNALKYFNDPQFDYRTIHVAGTTAKGSVVHILSKMLFQLGYKVGSFFSPHLLWLNERIMVNETEIPVQAMIDLWNYLKKSISLESLSFFDTITLMSFLYFRSENVDWAVIETGLGGRLDSTNNLKAEFAVISPIEKDHESILGDSLEKIAFEKAGIIHYQPVFSFPQREGVSNVLKQAATEKNTTISIYKPNRIYNCYNFIERNKMVCKWIFKSYFKTEAPKISYDLSGRLETLSEDPWVIFDGAHNVFSIETLLTWVRSQKQIKQWSFYFNCLRVKNIQKMLKPVFALRSKCSYKLYLIPTYQPKRFYSSKDTVIKDMELSSYQPNTVRFKAIHTEARLKGLMQRKDQTHLIFGSMYLYKQIISYFD